MAFGLILGLAAAWAVTSALLFALLARAGTAASISAVVVFTVYYAVRVWIWRGGGRPGAASGAGPAAVVAGGSSRHDAIWRALPLLVFAAPLVPACQASLATVGAFWLVHHPPSINASELVLALGVTVAAHVGLLAVGRARESRYRPLLAIALVAWPALLWLGSTALQIARFALFQRVGHPEDSAFLWDCFRSWNSGGPLLSRWVSEWGHTELRHYFGLHFSPVILPVFAVVKLAPRLETLLIIQNLLLAAGGVAWARVLAGQARRGRSESAGPGWRWTLALLAACPTLGASLRNELHPLLWALPVLALLHVAYRHRRVAWFLGATLLALCCREDLGLVVAGYAPLAWLEGRRRGGESVWLVLPLAGLAGTAALIYGVMPAFGRTSSLFFRDQFATSAGSFAPFFASLLAHPQVLLERVFRPGHWLIALRLGATGLGVPWRSWLWLPGVPLAVLFGLVRADRALLRIESHYALIPVLYLVAAGLLSVWESVRTLPPRRRDAVLICLWALGAAQQVRLLVPEAAVLRRASAYRSEVLQDLRQLDLVASAWVPVQLLAATPSSRAVPAHTLALRNLDPTRSDLPAAALLPARNPEQTDAHRLLSQHYDMGEMISHGTHYSLYRLSAR